MVASIFILYILLPYGSLAISFSMHFYLMVNQFSFSMLLAYKGPFDGQDRIEAGYDIKVNRDRT